MIPKDWPADPELAVNWTVGAITVMVWEAEFVPSMMVNVCVPTDAPVGMVTIRSVMSPLVSVTGLTGSVVRFPLTPESFAVTGALAARPYVSTRIAAPPVTIEFGRYSIDGTMVNCPAGLEMAPPSCCAVDRVCPSG